MVKILALVSYLLLECVRCLRIDLKSCRYYFIEILFFCFVFNYCPHHFSGRYYLYSPLQNDFVSLGYYLFILHFSLLLYYQLIDLIWCFPCYFMEIKYSFTIPLIDLQNYSLLKNFCLLHHLELLDFIYIIIRNFMLLDSLFDSNLDLDLMVKLRCQFELFQLDSEFLTLIDLINLNLRYLLFIIIHFMLFMNEQEVMKSLGSLFKDVRHL